MAYDYVFKPFKHQLEGIGLLRTNRYFGFFDEPGCGKSKVIVDGTNQLFADRANNLTVVVCPNTVKATWSNPVWGQVATHTPSTFPIPVMVRIDAGKRLPDALALKAYKGIRPVWIVVNYEALRSDVLQQWLMQVLQFLSPSTLVLDESTRIKNRTALQTKAVMRISLCAGRRYILTGTPITNNPLDLYSQINFLSKDILKFPSFVAFRNRYAEMGGYSVGGRPVEVVGWKNLDELRTKISKFSRVVSKEEALPDLPSKLYARIEVPLTKEQEKAYKQMREYAIAEFPGTVDRAMAPIALTKLLRLSQITAGHLTVSDGFGQSEIKNFKENPKVNVVLDLLQEHERLVVFGMFIAEIQQLEQALMDADISHGSIYGETPNTEREFIQGQYQAGHLRVVICQVVTGGIGITLTRGHAACFLTNPYSYEARRQAEDRLHRPGQTHNVIYYDIIATCEGERTIDATVLDVLKKKQDLSDRVLGHNLEEII
jgi:SNF2 family DNA or RNA helicase